MRAVTVTLVGILLTVGCKSKSQEKSSHPNDSLKVGSYEIQNLSNADKMRYNASLSAFFDTGLIKRGFNGGILVAKGGNVLYESYHGYENPNNRLDTITRHTPFHLASTSKPFTAVAVLRLVQDGKINLSDPVTAYFPSFPYLDVTVENLLTHRSGLPNYLSVMEDKKKWDPKQMVSNDDVLNFLEQYKPPVMFRTNSKFAYCNTNFVLLALIVEKVSGKKFPEYLKETIFGPLHMNDTFVYTPADSGRVIMSYKPSGALWANDMFDNTYGDKNVYSTPEDMFKWDRALYNTAFIRKSLLDSAYQPYSHEKPSIHNYGLGWRMLNLPNGKNVIYHNGKWHGFTPAFGRLPDEEAVVIILGNKLNSNIYNQARLAYDFFGDYMGQKTGGGEEGENRSAGAEAMPQSNLKPMPIPKKVAPRAPVAKKVPARQPVAPEKKSQKMPVKKAAVAPKKAPAKSTPTQKVVTTKKKTVTVKKK